LNQFLDPSARILLDLHFEEQKFEISEEDIPF